MAPTMEQNLKFMQKIYHCSAECCSGWAPEYRPTDVKACMVTCNLLFDVAYYCGEEDVHCIKLKDYVFTKCFKEFWSKSGVIQKVEKPADACTPKLRGKRCSMMADFYSSLRCAMSEYKRLSPHPSSREEGEK